MDAIQDALQDGVINQRTYGQMVRKVNDENRAAITSTASLTASTLTAVFAKSKAAAIAAAIISTAVGITNAMAGPPTGPPWPYNIAQAALIAASGAAQIATISRTNSSGGGAGASPTVGAGAASAESSAPTSAPQMLSINLSGSGRYSREEVVNLLNEINSAVSDGAQLVVKQ
jgi:hypothetical protein